MSFVQNLFMNETNNNEKSNFGPAQQGHSQVVYCRPKEY